MKKIKNLLFAFTVVAFILCVCLLLLNLQRETRGASAEGVEEEIVSNEESNDSSITPRGLYTSLSLSINGGNGKVWATVKNDFTLFPSTVKVIVELYSSDTYQESHLNMTLVSINNIDDLDMGKTIVAEASTGGVQKYWQARMRYKIDNGSWENRNTTTVLYDAEGNYLGYM